MFQRASRQIPKPQHSDFCAQSAQRGWQMRFYQNVQLSLMSSQQISYVSQFHQNWIQQHQKYQTYIQTQSLSAGEVARAHQIVPPECHHSESSRRWAACRSSTEPLEPHSEQAPAGRQPDSQAPVAWLVDRYRYNKQIEARTAIHLRNFSQFLCRIYQKPHQIFPESKAENLRNFSNSYAESIRNLNKSFQNPGRKSQKLLQFLCRTYQNFT